MVRELNETLFKLTPPDVFITAGMILLDFNAGKVALTNCGFEPIFRFEEEGGKVKGKMIKSNSQPLGLSLDMNPVINEFDLKENVKYLMYSDGVIDIKNEQGERYGDERLHESLKSVYKLPADEMVKRIEQELIGFMGKAPQADDITLLCVEL